MNTSGWARGYVAKYLEPLKFAEHIAGTLAKEFETSSAVDVAGECYVIQIGDFTVQLKRDSCLQAQSSGAYALDRLILSELELAGFEYEHTRSQYIRYCHSIFFRRPDGSVY
jgi:hypothetical protein